MLHSNDITLKVTVSEKDMLLFEDAARRLDQAVPQFILMSAVDKAIELLGEDSERVASQLELLNSESEQLREKAVERLMGRKAPWE